MAEQDLRSSTDSPSNTESVQNASPSSLPTDYHELHALLRRSLSTKLNLPAAPSNSSSSSSLTFYCIETGSVAQSIRRRQSLSTGTNVISQTTTTAAVPLAEGRPPTNEDDDSKAEEEEEEQQQQALPLPLTDVDRSYPSLTHSDNDSFNQVDGHDNDDDETLVDYSLHTESFPIPANYVSSPCPICFEQAVLQVSPCCYFLCCNQCWRAHISTTITDGRIKIPCVASDCAKYLTRESIVNFVRYDPPLHERYLKLYLVANQNPRAKTCKTTTPRNDEFRLLRLGPRCCHLYSLDVPTSASKEILSKAKKKINNKKIPKQVQCSECSLVWCFRCSAPWHENLTCKQFVKGDKLLLKWINQKNEEQWNARKCPKCSSLIQRAGGNDTSPLIRSFIVLRLSPYDLSIVFLWILLSLRSTLCTHPFHRPAQQQTEVRRSCSNAEKSFWTLIFVVSACSAVRTISILKSLGCVERFVVWLPPVPLLHHQWSSRVPWQLLWQCFLH